MITGCRSSSYSGPVIHSIDHPKLWTLNKMCISLVGNAETKCKRIGVITVVCLSLSPCLCNIPWHLSEGSWSKHRIIKFVVETCYNEHMCPISQLLSLVECFRLHVNKVCEHWRCRIYSSLRLCYNNSYWIHCTLEYVAVISKVHFSSSFCKIVAWALTVKLRPGECNRTLLIISQHWFVIGSCNGLVQPGNKPLPEPMFTQIYVAIWLHRATIIKSPQPGFQSLWFICIWLVRIFIWTWVIMMYKYFTCFVGIKTCQEYM